MIRTDESVVDHHQDRTSIYIEAVGHGMTRLYTFESVKPINCGRGV